MRPKQPNRNSLAFPMRPKQPQQRLRRLSTASSREFAKNNGVLSENSQRRWQTYFPHPPLAPSLFFIDEPVVEAGAEVEIELFPRDIEMLFHEIFAFILDSLPLVFLLRPLFTIKGQDMTARDALLRNARVIFAPSSAGCAVMAGATHHGTVSYTHLTLPTIE